MKFCLGSSSQQLPGYLHLQGSRLGHLCRNLPRKCGPQTGNDPSQMQRRFLSHVEGVLAWWKWAGYIHTQTKCHESYVSPSRSLKPINGTGMHPTQLAPCVKCRYAVGHQESKNIGSRWRFCCLGMTETRGVNSTDPIGSIFCSGRDLRCMQRRKGKLPVITALYLNGLELHPPV